jgi:deazaflavin-dependent oxidoreductase (nitroreductase family)
MTWVHRHTGNRMGSRPLLYLTTTGARSGQPRTAPVMRFEDGAGWVVCASAGRARTHPAWYHNVVAHPDQEYAEVDGTRHHVSVEQLAGPEREQAWQLVTTAAPQFGGYTTKTDRELPLLRLTPLD